MLKLECENPCEINERIAKELKLDGVDSKYPFQCDRYMLYNIDPKDIPLFNDEERAILTEYTPPEIEVI